MNDSKKQPTEFGVKLAKLRKERNWSMGELERRSGVPTSSISYYETEGRMPGLIHFRNLAAAFKMSMDEMADYDHTALPDDAVATPLTLEELCAAFAEFRAQMTQRAADLELGLSQLGTLVEQLNASKSARHSPPRAGSNAR
ncbi:MAG: hypothetical protein NVSMB64_18890 [Candidatus Velthaea sp.]